MDDDNLFINWLRENSQYRPTSQKKYFDNLEEPLSFICTPHISQLQHKFNDTKFEMHNQKDQIAELSKNIFKKLITRDNGEYVFGADNLSLIGAPKQLTHSSQERSKTTGQQIRTNRKITKRQFKFQKIGLNTEVPFASGVEEKKPLTLAQIKLLQTPQFVDKCSQYQFYDVFFNNKPAQIQKCQLPIIRLSQNQNIAKVMEKFKYNLIQQHHIIGEKSKHVTFNPEGQLQFYKIFSGLNQKDKQLNILGSCRNINLEHLNSIAMFDLAAGFVDTDLLGDFYLLKKQHQIKKKNQQSGQNLQKRYNQLKKRLEHYREMKFQNKSRQAPKKFRKQITQTLNNLQQPTYQEYFASSLNENLIILEELKKIRNQIIKNQDDALRRTMLININEDIRQLLFYILLTLFDGERAINYQQFIFIGDKTEAERKLLDLIHQKFQQFGRKQIDGRSKLQLLKLYIKQRKICEQTLQVVEQRWK